jgi:hypothetical protein
MHAIDTQSWMVLGVIALAVFAGIGIWASCVRQRLSKLQQAFSVDYRRIVERPTAKPTLSHG